MEDQKNQTCDFYRTDPDLPERFNNPEFFNTFRVRKTHPLYRTWNQTYGSKKPTVHEMQTGFKVMSHHFSEHYLRFGMHRDQGFNTAVDRSWVMHPMETQNKRYQLQHVYLYGHQCRASSNK
ncbi:piercer of microtubule wall 2 protein [Poecilia latipinna]|uniref:Uncharacterized protein n=3 Tax=Poecilia TaxID=8080 RepID=A0A096M649_POEFO|nr:PREDICTED: UPF0691 protein C9orf116 homolog isoform X2 [Poecilia formosa]XP_014881309.1 PREDICTED: UPF0691 protein C9orf116 homolog [Poecilia latipinna]